MSLNNQLIQSIRRKPLRQAIALCLAFGLTASHAIVFNVTNNSDSDPKSLRDAVNSANANAGPDHITIDPGLGAITLTSG